MLSKGRILVKLEPLKETGVTTADIESLRCPPFHQDTACLIRNAEIRRAVCERFIVLCQRMTPELEADLAGMPYRDFLETDYWAYLRDYFVMSRGMQCEACHHAVGLLFDSLEVHHISYDHRGSEWRHAEDLKVLCRVCHAKERR